MFELSTSKEHYLKAIYKLALKDGNARVTDIADKLGVTKASACCAVRDLEEKGFVHKGADHHVYLTEKGTRTALTMMRNYALIKRFFIMALGISEQNAGVQACALEHVISDEGICSIERILA
ncbi:metal-dependent transcriptional regulator [Lachnospiraceae bacterium ZAX-1]